MTDPIINIEGDYTLDLSKIVLVGPVSGDPECRRYNVWFTSGRNLEIYHSDARSTYQPRMDREEFVALWRRAYAS